MGDGRLYDQEAITKWFDTHDTSPVTGALLTREEKELIQCYPFVEETSDEDSKIKNLQEQVDRLEKGYTSARVDFEKEFKQKKVERDRRWQEHISSLMATIDGLNQQNAELIDHVERLHRELSSMTESAKCLAKMYENDQRDKKAVFEEGASLRKELDKVKNENVALTTAVEFLKATAIARGGIFQDWTSMEANPPRCEATEKEKMPLLLCEGKISKDETARTERPLSPMRKKITHIFLRLGGTSEGKPPLSKPLRAPKKRISKDRSRTHLTRCALSNNPMG